MDAYCKLKVTHHTHHDYCFHKNFFFPKPTSKSPSQNEGYPKPARFIGLTRVVALMLSFPVTKLTCYHNTCLILIVGIVTWFSIARIQTPSDSRRLAYVRPASLAFVSRRNYSFHCFRYNSDVTTRRYGCHEDRQNPDSGRGNWLRMNSARSPDQGPRPAIVLCVNCPFENAFIR